MKEFENKILEFPLGEPRLISKIRQKIKKPNIASARLKGEKLENHGIFDGDYIVFDLNAEIKAGSLAFLKLDGNLCAFIVREITDETVILESNRSYEYSRSRVEFCGKVIRIERDL